MRVENPESPRELQLAELGATLERTERDRRLMFISCRAVSRNIEVKAAKTDQGILQTKSRQHRPKHTIARPATSSSLHLHFFCMPLVNTQIGDADNLFVTYAFSGYPEDRVFMRCVMRFA